MSIAELKQRLSDVPGIDTLTMVSIAGRDCYQFNGKIAAVDPGAGDSEIADAIRKAASLGQKPQAEPPADLSIPVQDTAKPKVSTMSITGAAHAGLSLKQMMAEKKAKVAAAHEKLSMNMGKLDQATAALDSLGDDVGSEADDLLATIGQFKNDLG